MENISDVALLSAFIRPHLAEYLLRHDPLAVILQKGPSELEALGLGPREVERIEGLPALLRRSTPAQGPRLGNPSETKAYLQAQHLGRVSEVFGLIGLNAKSELMFDQIISMGTASETLVTPREVFYHATRMGAVSVIVWHNHPTGDPAPSQKDVQNTNALRDAGTILGIPLVDHVIVGAQGCYSFCEMLGWHL